MHPRDTRKHPGIKRPYLSLPESTDGTQSFCVTIPDGLDNKLVLIDLLGTATMWFNWDRSAGTEGKQTADAWRDALNLPELNMCGCCPQPTNRRYNADGELEVSYDGGLTWSPDPAADDRFSGIVSPPIPGADGADKRCAAAASAEEYVKQNLIDALSDGDTYAQIYGAAVAIIAALGVTGIGILIAAAAAAIFVAGVAAVQAAFTSEVWTDFRCILYCHIDNDGSFSETGWEQVKSEVLGTYTGVVSAILYNWVNSVGPVGLTNAARSGFVASADCDACECGCSEGCTPTVTTYLYNDPAWIAHGAYHRTLASTPVGQFDSFILLGTTALIDIGGAECITNISITANNACPPGTAAGIECFIGSISQGVQIPTDRAGCGTPVSASWTIVGGYMADQISFAQVGPNCAGGYSNGNRILCIKVTTCE